jgi:hypothetical protein
MDKKSFITLGPGFTCQHQNRFKGFRGKNSLAFLASL